MQFIKFLNLSTELKAKGVVMTSWKLEDNQLRLIHEFIELLIHEFMSHGSGVLHGRQAGPG